MKIDFEFDTAHGLFRDALHLPDDHTFTDDEIQAMKQQRVDNWIAVVTAPAEEVPPVEEVWGSRRGGRGVIGGRVCKRRLRRRRLCPQRRLQR